MSKLKSLFVFLKYSNKNNFFLIIFLTFILGLIELTSIFSIMPFISIIVNPEYLENNYYIIQIKKYFSLNNTNSFIIFFGLLILVLNFFANLLNAFVNWYINLFVYKFNESFTKKLFSIYLFQPYNFYTKINTADLKKNLITEINRIVNGMVMPLIVAISKGQILLVIIIFLTFYNTTITLLIFIFFSIIYGIVYLLVRRKLKNMGDESTIYLTEIYKVINHAFLDIKYLKLMRYEEKFLNKFSIPIKRYTQYSAVSNIISQIPKYLIEFLSFAIIISLAIVLIILGYGKNTMATLSLYAFAGYKIMPIIQQIFLSIVQVRYNNKAYQILINQMALSKYEKKLDKNNRNLDIKFEKFINLSKISFSHSGSSTQTLKNIDLKILKNEFVCFVGSTGCGKSTLVDIISQIHVQDDGALEVDGTMITKNNLDSWQKKLGYVPQATNLFEGSILQNITFNLFENKNEKNIDNIIKIVELEKFIYDLPNGLNTNIGDMGVKLSGGQKQRISIARAIYQNPEIFLFDEPTSALDKDTETIVISNLKKYYKNKTIIIVSHNDNIIKHADKICFLHDGQIGFYGTYDNYRYFLDNDAKK